MKKAAVPSILVIVVLLAVGVTADAQQPTKIPRIGYLSTFDLARESARAEESAGPARAWLHRRSEHRHRVPVYGRQTPIRLLSLRPSWCVSS